MKRSPGTVLRHTSCTFGRAAAAAATSMLLGTAAASQPAPGSAPELALAVSPKSLDLGTVLDAHVVEQSIMVENRSDAPVRIVDVRDSCGGCTAYSLDQEELAPDDSTLLLLRIDPFGMQGDINVLVAVVTSETNLPQRVVHVTGRITPAYTVEGGPKGGETVFKGRPQSWTVRVTPNVELPSPLDRAISSEPGFVATVSPAADGTGFLVEITTEADLELGDSLTMITVEGAAPGVPACRIPVAVRCIPPVGIFPEELVFSPIAAEQLRILFVRPYADPRMRVTGLTLPDNHFKYRLLRESGLSWQRINVYAYALEQNAGFAGDIIIETDLDGGTPIRVPVYVEEQSRDFIPR